MQVPAIITNLANFIATQPTNSEKLKGILFEIETLTNALAEATSRPTFDLYINDIKIINGTVLDVKQSRMLRIEVRNTSAFSLEQLYVDFAAPLALDQTNLDAAGWTLGPIKVMTGAGPSGIPKANSWTWHATQPIPGSVTDAGYGDFVHAYYAEFLHVSTNFHYPVIQVRIAVSAVRAKISNYTVTLLL